MPIITIKATVPVYVEIDTDADRYDMVRSVVVADESISNPEEYLDEIGGELGGDEVAPYLDQLDFAWSEACWPAWQFGY